MYISTNLYMYRFSISLYSEMNLSTRKCHLTRSCQEETILFWFVLRFSKYVISACLLSTLLYSLSEDWLAINQTYLYIHICIVLHVMIIFTISNVLWMANKIFCVLQLFIYTFTNDRYSGRIKAKILFRMQFI